MNSGSLSGGQPKLSHKLSMRLKFKAQKSKKHTADEETLKMAIEKPTSLALEEI